MKIKNGQGQVQTPEGSLRIDFKSKPILVQGENDETIGFGLGLVHAYFFYSSIASSLSLLKGQLSKKIKKIDGLEQGEEYFANILGPFTRQNLEGELDVGTRAFLQMFCQGFFSHWGKFPGIQPWAALGGVYENLLSPGDIILLHDVMAFFHWWQTEFPRFRFLQKSAALGIEDPLIQELFPLLKTGLEPALSFLELKQLDKDPGSLWRLIPVFRRSLSVLSPLDGKKSQSLHQISGLWGQNNLLFIETRTPNSKVRGYQYPGVPFFHHGDNGSISWGGQPVARGTIHPVLLYLEGGQYKTKDETHKVMQEPSGQWRTHFGPLLSQYRPTGWALSLSWARPRKGLCTLYRLQKSNSWEEGKKVLHTHQGPAFDWMVQDQKGAGGLVRGGLYFQRSFDEGLWVLGEDSPSPGYKTPGVDDVQELRGEALVLGRRDLAPNMVKDSGREWAKCLLDENPSRDLKILSQDIYSAEARSFFSLIRSYLPSTGPGSELSHWDCRLDPEKRQYSDYIGLFGAVLDTLVHTQIHSSDFFRFLFPEDPVALSLWEEWNWILKKPSSLWWKGGEKETGFSKAVKAFNQGLVVPQIPMPRGNPLEDLWNKCFSFFNKPKIKRGFGRGGLNTISPFWIERRGVARIAFGLQASMVGKPGESLFFTPEES